MHPLTKHATTAKSNRAGVHMIMTTMTDKTFDVCSVCIAWEFAMLLDSPGDQIGVNDRVFIVRSFLGPWRHFLEQLIVEAQPDAACVEGAPLADIQKSRMLEEVKLSHTKHRVILIYCIPQRSGWSMISCGGSSTRKEIVTVKGKMRSSSPT